MYIPKQYLGEDRKDAIAFMKRFNFASMVTVIDDVPVATHLPFVVSEREDQIIISSHLAKANEHGKHINSKENLIIFSEPHAYVSPKHYNKLQNVPTWNYMSVHAYGKANLIEEPAEVIRVLETMIDSFEAAYRKQWESLSPDYKSKMANGIVAFEIVVDRIQFKEKLSQNKARDEQDRIIESFEKSDSGSEQMIAEYMKKKKLVRD